MYESFNVNNLKYASVDNAFSVLVSNEKHALFTTIPTSLKEISTTNHENLGLTIRAEVKEISNETDLIDLMAMIRYTEKRFQLQILPIKSFPNVSMNNT